MKQKCYIKNNLLSLSSVLKTDTKIDQLTNNNVAD